MVIKVYVSGQKTEHCIRLQNISVGGSVAALVLWLQVVCMLGWAGGEASQKQNYLRSALKVCIFSYFHVCLGHCGWSVACCWVGRFVEEAVADIPISECQWMTLDCHGTGILTVHCGKSLAMSRWGFRQWGDWREGKRLETRRPVWKLFQSPWCGTYGLNKGHVSFFSASYLCYLRGVSTLSKGRLSLRCETAPVRQHKETNLRKYTVRKI